MNKFEDNILRAYKEKGRVWLTQLAKIIQQISQEWRLSDLTPVDNLSFNYVMSGRQGPKDIILKLSLQQEDIKRETEALQAFSGYGGVEILECNDNALLLRRAIPGESLKNISEGAIRISCDLTKRLHQAPIPRNNSFLTIESRYAYLDQDWGVPHLEKARILKREILDLSAQKVLLHGDLHRDNIISDGNDWLAIDPKGVIGYPINEVWAFVENIEEDIPIIAKEFGFEKSMVMKCYFVHAVLAACWAVEDGLDPNSWLEKTGKIRSIL